MEIYDALVTFGMLLARKSYVWDEHNAAQFGHYTAEIVMALEMTEAD